MLLDLRDVANGCTPVCLYLQFKFELGPRQKDTVKVKDTVTILKALWGQALH